MNTRKILMAALAGVVFAGLIHAQQAGRGPDGFPAGRDAGKEPGILVAAVLPDSPAERAGMKRGDIALSLDGKAVNSIRELRELLLAYKAGQDVRLVLQRGTAQVTAVLRLEDRIGKPLIGILEAEPRGFGGPGREDAGGAGRDGKAPDFMPGLLVREVTDGSPAERAGIKEGDLIVSVDGGRILDFTAIFAGKKTGDIVKIEYIRPSEGDTPGTNKTVQVVLAAKDGKPWLGILGGMPGKDGPRPDMHGRAPLGGPRPPSTNPPFGGI
jgi:S1-C subfamily serine protease